MLCISTNNCIELLNFQSSGTPNTESSHRARSLSPSPPRACRLQGQLEDNISEALSVDDGKQTNLTPPGNSQREEVHHRPSHKKHSKVLTQSLFSFPANEEVWWWKKWWNESLFQSVQTKAYEEELKRYEDKERAELDKARLRAQEAVSHYYDVLCSLSTMRKPLSPPPLFTTSYQCLGHWGSAPSVSHIHLWLESVVTGLFYSCTKVTT